MTTPPEPLEGMRLAFVLPSLRLAGAEQVMVRLAVGSADAGATVTVVAVDGSGDLRARIEARRREDSTGRIELIDLGHGRASRALPSLLGALRRIGPDVVISSQTHLNVLLSMTRVLLGRGVRLVVREPTFWVVGPEERRIVRMVRTRAVRRADHVIASSETMRRDLERRLGRGVDFLPSPIDLEGIRSRAKGHVRAAAPGRHLLYVGRLAVGKGVEDLLVAFAAAATQEDRLTVVGDGPLRSQLAVLAAELGVEDRVVMTGELPDPTAMMAVADALIIPSHFEGMPNVALEALAIGTPVIATTDLVALAELGQRIDGGTLRVVPREALADAIRATSVIDCVGRRPSLPEDHDTAAVLRRLGDILSGRPGRGTEGRDGRLRILMPTLSPFPSALAPSIQSTNMAQAFAELGHDVLLVSANADTRADALLGAVDAASLYGFDPGFSAITLSGRPFRGQSVIIALRFRSLAAREDPDLIVSRDLRSCLLPALRGVPTVFEVHSLTSIETALDMRVTRRLMRASGFRGFIAISAALAEDLRHALGVAAEKVLVAHDAVRVEGSATAAASWTAGGSLRVTYTGSLFRGRGVEHLVEVARRAPWIDLRLTGGPADEAVRWRSSLEDLPNVTVEGMVTPARARRIQLDSDVLVAPFGRAVITDSGVDTSRWMSPMKVFEYMASGRPIVISDLPVLREVLRPDVDALMVPPEDPDAILHALQRLRDNPSLGERIAASALRRAREEFTWRLRAESILARFG